MSRSEPSKSSGLAPHVVAGSLVWLIYGVIETAFVTVLPETLELAHLPVPESWWSTLAYLVLYILQGAAIGLLVAAIPGVDRLRPMAAATAALCAIVAVHSIVAATRTTWSSEALVLLLILSLTGLSLILVVPRVREVARSDPWFFSLMLVGLPWIGAILAAGKSRLQQAIAMASFALVILGLWWIVRFLPNRVKRVMALAVALAVVGAALASGLEREIIRRPGPSPGLEPPVSTIVLVVLDTVRADHLSVYGYERPTTPFLTRFAETSNLYRQAVSPSNVTLTSHASMFTGLPGSEHGAHWLGGQEGAIRHLPETEVTIAEILRREGYSTIAVVANYGFLDPSFNLDQGFSVYDFRPNRAFPGWYQPMFYRGSVAEALGVFVTHRWRIRPRRATEINAEAGRFLREVAGRPAFVFLNYMEAHLPYFPEPGMELDECAGLDGSRMLGLESELPRRQNTGRVQLAPDERRYLECQYDGAIRSLDAALEDLVRRLKALDRYEDALIIITSDHGEAFGDKGYLFHSSTAYEDQVRVPLIIRLPNQTEGRTIDDPVGVAAVFDVILGGIDLNRRTTENAERPSTVVAESFPLLEQAAFAHPSWTGRAVYDENWKLLVSTSGHSQLFDLSRDPDERFDLSGQHPERVAEMERKLGEWVGTIEPPSDPGGILLGGRFRALGYLR